MKNVTIASRSRQIGKKLQTWTKTAPPPGLNIEPSKDTSIKSGLPQKSSEGKYTSLLGGV